VKWTVAGLKDESHAIHAQPQMGAGDANVTVSRVGLDAAAVYANLSQSVASVEVEEKVLDAIDLEECGESSRYRR
jgi:hypothetical protein